MRILRLFKNHLLALAAVAALLVVSANADLALPSLMSEIVDVGIQQGGIESPVPDAIRASSLDDLERFMSDEDLPGNGRREGRGLGPRAGDGAPRGRRPRARAGR